MKLIKVNFDQTKRERYLRISIWSTILATTLIGLVRATIRSGDTEIMASASVELVKCAQNQIWSNCVGAAGAPYGLLQFIPALFLAWKGFSPSNIVSSLGLLSVVSYFLTCIVIMRISSKPMAHKTFLCLIIISGPLIGYAPSSFGECLAVLVLICLVVCLVNGHWLTILILSMIAVMWRESAILFIAPVGYGILLRRYNFVHIFRQREFWALTFGLIVGFSCTCLFNLWRFGTWKNTNYLNPEFRTPGFSLPARVFGSLYLSPSGGVLVIWFFAALITIVVPLLAIYQSGRFMLLKNVSPVLLICAPLGQAFLLSKWYSPFGWIAWGPRTMIPAIAMASAACCLVFPGALDKVLRSRSVIPLSILSFVSLVPSIGYLYKPSEVIADFMTVDKSCPTVPVIQIDREYYFHCLETVIWKVDHSMFYAGWRGTSGVLPGIIIVLFAITYFLQVLSGRDLRKQLAVPQTE
jgi:hypothetical protein